MIKPGFVVQITLADFTFRIKDPGGVINSHIGHVSTSTYNTLFSTLQPILKLAINTIFSKGLSLNWLLVLLDLTFVELDDSKLEPFDGYFIFYCTPTFNI